MAEGIVSDAAMTVMGYIGNLGVEMLTPCFGGRENVEVLKGTLQKIQARLRDAESRGEGEREGAVKQWLKRLKRLLYRMEDLFEEVQLEMESLNKGGNMLFRKRHFMSNFPHRKSKVWEEEGADIMRELEIIKGDMGGLYLRELPPIQEEARLVDYDDSSETGSFFPEGDVISREDDKNQIMRMLFDTTHGISGRHTVSIIPIVGMGGLGKTALAWLAYDDENVQRHFDLKAWACISQKCRSKELARIILDSLIVGDCGKLSLLGILNRVREAIEDRKYLLVLDDVRDEDPNTWSNLRRFLRFGKQGSKIIVSTRSRVVAENMGTVEPYHLGGLTEEKSWALFERLAFREGRDRNPNLMRIGRDIVENCCANYPLAIRAVAGLLHSKDTEAEWEHIRNEVLRAIETNGINILWTLKLCYNHLPAHLKQCFAYCSLFPKYYIISKDDLIKQWIAQGFVKASNRYKNQPLHDIRHRYFLQLLRRSFFQHDTSIVDDDGKTTYKMHDLMNDLARDVVRDECLLVEKSTEEKPIKFNEYTYHVSFVVDNSWKPPSWLLDAKQLRSLLLLPRYGFHTLDTREVFLSLRHLRVLYCEWIQFEMLPDSIGELRHLRYLKLDDAVKSIPEGFTKLQRLHTLDLTRCNEPIEFPEGFHNLANLGHLRYLKLVGAVESLPEGFTKLQSLHTLDLSGCRKHIEFPEGFHNLANLRHLYNISHCSDFVIHMPPGLEKLTGLETLSGFEAGEKYGIDALAPLRSLAGKLKIYYERGRVSEEGATGGILKDTKLTHLDLLWCDFDDDVVDDSDVEEDERAINCMQPPLSLKSLYVCDWEGVRFPSCWSLTNLVTLEIRQCCECRRIPALSQMPCLKELRLVDFTMLEYIEEAVGDDGNNDPCAWSSAAAAPISYPSLEKLELSGLWELQGWTRPRALEYGDEEHPVPQQLAFPKTL